MAATVPAKNSNSSKSRKVGDSNWNLNLGSLERQLWKSVFEGTFMSQRPMKKVRSPERQATSHVFTPDLPIPSSRPVFPFSYDEPQPVPGFHPQQQIQQQQMISFDSNQYRYSLLPHQQQQLLQYWSETLQLSPRGIMMMMNKMGQDGRAMFKHPLPFTSTSGLDFSEAATSNEAQQLTIASTTDEPRAKKVVVQQTNGYGG